MLGLPAAQWQAMKDKAGGVAWPAPRRERQAGAAEAGDGGAAKTATEPAAAARVDAGPVAVRGATIRCASRSSLTSSRSCCRLCCAWARVCVSCRTRSRIYVHVCVPRCPPTRQPEHAHRMSETRRLRHLFEQMDRHRSGELSAADFKNYMARHFPSGVARAGGLFQVMAAKCDGDARPGAARLTFVDVRSFLLACPCVVQCSILCGPVVCCRAGPRSYGSMVICTSGHSGILQRWMRAAHAPDSAHCQHVGSVDWQ
jgi:hypothetical protein